MKKKLLLIFLSLVGVFGVLAGDRGYVKEQNIYINEVRCWDASAKRNGYFGSCYIELYNASGEDICLDGWYVSDDPTDLKKSRLYDVKVGAQGFVLLYANGKADSGDSLNFKISPEGERIFLSDQEGNLVDKVYVPKQDFGTVYARRKDGTKDWCVQEETADDSNNGAELLMARNLESPMFSHESGFYEETFELTISAELGQTVYYTLDGSEPTKDSQVYQEPILIENISNRPNICNSVQQVVLDWENYIPSMSLVDKAVVVRAVAIDENDHASEVVTHTYFVNENEYSNKNIVSLAADYEELFGDHGIFSTGSSYDEAYLSGTLDENVKANFLQKGRRWEIRGNMQLLESGKELLNQSVGIRTQGASTRLNPKKRMSIYSREEYHDSDYFEKLNFEGRKSHALLLNASVSNVALPELVKDRDVSVQNAMEAVVFLNGEYWYDCYLLEKYNRFYLEEIYGVNKDNVIVIKDDGICEGPEGSYDIYGELLAYMTHTDLSSPENYAYLEGMADMQSYIDYICTNVYLCNMDMSETKNYLCWRTIEDDGSKFGDSRWRWMIYDTDCVEWMDCSYYGESEKAAVNSFIEPMQFTGVAIDEQLIYSSVKNNEKFRKQFVLTFMDMANVNFSMENVTAVFEKWNSSPDIYGEFFEHRFDYIVPYMAEEFDLTGTLENVTLRVNDIKGGTIWINTTVPDLTGGSWMGKYYTDYPITVTAIPEDGYEFAGWHGSVSSNRATIETEVLVGGITLEAVFKKSAD